jgi:GDP-4-dehydro-6-deoxy-D-mannose reductase
VRQRSKIVITGIAGFAGSYLAEMLLSKRYRVFGLLAPGEKTEHIKKIKSDLTLERFDIRNGEKVSRFIRRVKPQYIYHLAAFSSVGKSYRMQRFVYEINFFGTLNLFEAANYLSGRIKKILFVSSADVYGVFSPKTKTLTENQSLSPISPYGISKAAGEHLASHYYLRQDLPIVIARAFNHTGPRQSHVFVVPSFCRQIAEIERRRKRPVVRVGDLSSKRDLSDVRDIVRGYYLAVQKGQPGRVYQFCSGRAVSIKSVLSNLLSMSEYKISVKTDKTRLRKSDIPCLRGSSNRAAKELGWHCRYKLNETLRDTLGFWRKRVTEK